MSFLDRIHRKHHAARGCADTPDTPRNREGYQPKALQNTGCTPDTPDTPRKSKAETKPERRVFGEAEQRRESLPDGWHQTPGGFWELWADGRCITVQNFHPETGERCEHKPPARDPAAERQGRARIERLARELGGDPDELLEWFADDLEILARLRWEEARGIVAEALSDFLHDNDER